MTACQLIPWLKGDNSIPEDQHLWGIRNWFAKAFVPWVDAFVQLSNQVLGLVFELLLPALWGMEIGMRTQKSVYAKAWKPKKQFEILNPNIFI